MERAESTEKKFATPSTEAPEEPVRRRFSTEYKLRILAETDACTEMGQIGELLRREGLYGSILSTWRKQRKEGTLAALTPKRRGRKPKKKNPLADEVAKLQSENQSLKTKLRKAELVIHVQKKSPKCWTSL